MPAMLRAGAAYVLFRAGLWSYSRGWYWLARPAWDRVVRLVPFAPLIHHALAALRHREGDDLAAVSYTTTGLTLNPHDASMMHTRGTALYHLGETAAALGCFNNALERQPDNRACVSASAFALLRAGHYPAGFAAYEARTHDPEVVARLSGIPRWSGEDLGGKTLLVWMEQGYGDALQFIRYVPRLTPRAGRILVLCPPALTRLFRTLPGIEVIDAWGACPEVDWQVPVASLPYHFGTTVDTIPTGPYLYAPTDARVSLPAGDKFKAGLVWSGQVNNARERMRPVPLDACLPLFVGAASWYSLQVGPAAREIRRLGLSGVLHDLSPQLQDFADTASAMSQLDLVITVDTSVAHLAGAMGKPVWILLPYAADWRWFEDRTDSPWYPSARLFRQPWPGNWVFPILGVREALEAELRQRGRAATAPAWEASPSALVHPCASSAPR